MQWLYSQKLVIRQLTGEIHCGGEIDACELEDSALVELWALAEQLELPLLQNLAISTIHEISLKCDLFSIESLWRAYEITSTGSTLRGFFIALYVSRGTFLTMEDVSKEILYDLLTQAFKALRTGYLFEITDFFFPTKDAAVVRKDH